MLVGVGEFWDARREEGSTFELPGLPLESRFINARDLGNDVATAAARELSKRGYEVLRYSGIPPDTVDYTISGRIEQLTTTALILRLEVRRRFVPVFDRIYSQPIHGLDGLGLRPGREQVVRALAAAYEELVRQVMIDLQGVIRTR